MDKLSEKRLDGELKYKGVIVDVFLDRAELCDGRIVKREVVKHPGGVAVIPVDDEGNCCLVKQFRYPFQKIMLEVPAGKLELGEDHAICAARELSEETGLTADQLIDLGCCCTSPGYSSEILHVFLALGLHQGIAHPDEGEYLNLEQLSLSEMKRLVMSNQIDDAKTVIAVLKAAEYLKI